MSILARSALEDLLYKDRYYKRKTSVELKPEYLDQINIELEYANGLINRDGDNICYILLGIPTQDVLLSEQFKVTNDAVHVSNTIKDNFSGGFIVSIKNNIADWYEHGCYCGELLDRSKQTILALSARTYYKKPTPSFSVAALIPCHRDFIVTSGSKSGGLLCSYILRGKKADYIEHQAPSLHAFTRKHGARMINMIAYHHAIPKDDDLKIPELKPIDEISTGEVEA